MGADPRTTPPPTRIPWTAIRPTERVLMLTSQRLALDLPPTDAPMPQTTQGVLIAVTILATVAMVAWVVWLRQHSGSTAPLFVLVGSLLVVFYEPLGDSLLGAYYPEAGQVTAIHAFGRDMPLFVLLLYPPYFVPFVVAFLELARRGFTVRSWWTLWVVTLVSGGLMEMVLMQFGNPWLYYGRQTLMIFEFPLWVTVTNVTFLFATAVVVRLIVTRLDTRHHWMVIPAVPIMTISGHAAVALPGAATRESSSDLVMLAGGLGSIAVAVLIGYALSLAYVGRGAPAVEPTVDATR
ncbi:hypothetical protein ACIRON_16905 [Nocardioides sp. NPDC101246]|uniref:hypothetical protein n=1 Tax=Nocardioides sp. NPDC101246 TaxID=3364336 RepID=UPI00381939A9